MFSDSNNLVDPLLKLNITDFLDKGWATNSPRAASGPRAILVQLTRPLEEKNRYGWMLHNMYVYLY